MVNNYNIAIRCKNYFFTAGQLSVKNLDYETLNKYKLLVTASDGKQSTDATVNVNVIDAEDAPHFERSVFQADVTENAVENTVVQTLGVASETSGGHRCEWGVKGVTPTIISLFTLTTELRSCVVKVGRSDAIKWRKEAFAGYEFEVKAINMKNENEQSTALLKGRVYHNKDFLYSCFIPNVFRRNFHELCGLREFRSVYLLTVDSIT